MAEALYYGNVTEQQFRDGRRYAEILAMRFARKLPGWVDREDVRAVACEGMLKAAQHYRPERGKWVTIMTPAIFQFLSKHYRAELNWHRQRNAHAHLTPEERADIAPFSLDQLCRESEKPLLDMVAAPDDTESEILARADAAERRRGLVRILSELRPHHRDLLVLRAEGMTLRGIAQQKGVTQEAIRLQEKRALRDARRAAARLGVTL